MIKIGRSYFNENQIAAIEPDRAGDSAVVHLTTGGLISVHVYEDDLAKILGWAGMLRSRDEPVSMLEFTPEERGVLLEAWTEGYLFAAKDSSGHVFVYAERPEKGRSSWLESGEEGKPPKRLAGDYDVLSWDDDVPLDLVALFGQDGEEEG